MMSDGPPPDYPDEGRAAAAPPADKLIFRPAKREKVGLIIGMSGPSWSGKTYSALELAMGLAGPGGTVALLDTEQGRGLTYADDFDFVHGPLTEPFSPRRYADAAAVSKQAGHNVLIIDSMSHEHAGPGGVLEMHEAELHRLAGTDFKKREAMKMVAWIKPKMQHKAMVQRLLQLNCHLVLCFRAEEKTEIQMLPNNRGVLVNTPVNIGFQPVTGKDMAYELTILLGFNPKSPGVPIPIKLADKFRPFVPLDRQLDRSTGERLAAWARGEKPQPTAGLNGRQEARPTPSAGSLSRDAPPEQKTEDDPRHEPPPPDKPKPEKEDKSPAVAEALKLEYEATKSLPQHFALVDDPIKRKQVEWLKKNRKELFQQVNQAVAESYKRNHPPTEGPLI